MNEAKIEDELLATGVPEGIKDVFQRIKDGGDMDFPKPKIDKETAMKLWTMERSDYAKEQVILNNIGLVPYALKTLNQSVFDEDLFAIGVIGLCKAINGFDASKDVKFNTYASWAIRNEILMSFRKKRIIPTFSIDEPCALDNGEEVSYADMMADSKQFEEDALAGIQFEEIMNLLSEREREIISFRMGGKTQNEIAKIFGLSQKSISKIIKDSCKKCKKILED